MRIDCNRINFSKNILHSLHQLGTEYDCSTQSCINMKPYFVLSTNLSNLFYWIDITLNCSPHCCIYKHTNVAFLQLFLNTSIKLLRNHSTTLICFYINDIIFSNTTKMSSFFHWVMRCLWCEYFQWFISITFGLRTMIEIEPGSCNGHEVSKGSTWSEDCVNILPF